MPGLFRKPSKPSQSVLGCALVLAIGLTIEFLQRVWLDFNVNQHHVKIATLPLYWMLWNLLPLTLFGIGKVLQRQGR